jgi:LysR family glycine cleavage system transcriptional activator
MVRRLPSLNALRAFEAAARHVSFTLAAAELNVTHAAISRHIRELEASVGDKLFHRTGRGVELTEIGKAFSADLSVAFDRLAEATDRFAKTRARPQLVISAEVPFAALWLVPRLGGFTAKHPGIDLVLDPTNRLVDFSKNEADLGIRYGGGQWRDVDAQELVDCALSPVCSPALMTSLAIKTPADLVRAPLIRDESKALWSDWFKAAGVSLDTLPPGPTLNGHLAIAAAEAGQGFALGDDIIAGNGLLTKRLVRPFKVSVRDCAYYVVRGMGTKDCEAASAFRMWLIEEVAACLAALRKKGL